MGLMFNKIIPMEMLANMPLSFVHRLRDIRCEQLKEQAKQQHLTENNNNWANENVQNLSDAYNRSGIEDLVDELS